MQIVVKGFCVFARSHQESISPGTSSQVSVRVDGKRYCLTHLGFGLNVAPLIMKAIISMVLAQEETVGCTVSAYIDDMYINEDLMPVTHVRTSDSVWNGNQRPGMVER